MLYVEFPFCLVSTCETGMNIFISCLINYSGCSDNKLDLYRESWTLFYLQAIYIHI